MDKTTEDDLRRVMKVQGGDIWSMIATAISIAARDHHDEFLLRRDSIIRDIFALSLHVSCKCDLNRVNGSDVTRVETNPVHAIGVSPEIQSETPRPESEESPETVEKQNANPTNPQISKILAIKDFLKDHAESDEESLVNMLKNLGTIDITYEALKETGIGHVLNSLRKHASSNVGRLAKQMIKKWKETVDLWAKSNSRNYSSPAIQPSDFITDEAPPATVNGSDLKETKPKPVSIRVVSSKRNGSDPAECQSKPALTRPVSLNRAGDLERIPKPDLIRVIPDPRTDGEEFYNSARLDNARKRLQRNYQEANKAKKQRTVQILQIHEIPKPENELVRRSVPTSRHR